MDKTLRQLREADPRMLTQAEVAVAVGTSAPNYNRIELGYHVPRLSLIRKLAEFFEIDPGELRDQLQR